MTEVEQASIKDVPGLVTLVNKAYRGEAARAGWTHEADLIEGNKRIDLDALRDLLTDPNSVILKHTSGSQITGCVYLQRQEKKLYLGMLSVDPACQASGIGKKLLRASEAYARQMNYSSIIMTVISVRKELIAWYERHGYKNTGLEKPFHDDGRFGMPRQALRFVILEKILT